MRLFAAGRIVAPLARQIEPIGDRQAGMMVGDRQRHRHLAIGLLTELPAVLMMHPDRMRTFLGKPCVVDDPDFDRTAPCHRRRHLFAHFGEHLLIRPRGIVLDGLPSRSRYAPPCTSVNPVLRAKYTTPIHNTSDSPPATLPASGARSLSH